MQILPKFIHTNHTVDIYFIDRLVNYFHILTAVNKVSVIVGI